MRRLPVALFTTIAVAASLSNPHFLLGGAFDVYGIDPWWQPTAAVLDLAVLTTGAALLWRGQAARALRLLLGEGLLYVLLTAAAALAVGRGYFSNGWGHSFSISLAVALVSRGLLLAVGLRWPPACRVATS